MTVVFRLSCVCSRSQGQPPGARRRAISSTSRANAAPAFSSAMGYSRPMKLPLYQVDAFASRPFAGNPAAVVPLPRWVDDALLQAIATENNLSETAFLVGGGGGYEIRWMRPATEGDLWGHAPLASAWVVFEKLEPGRREVTFFSNSGPLKV